jgi:hypothetical protein
MTVYPGFGPARHDPLNGDRVMLGLSLRPSGPARHDPFLCCAVPGHAPKARARPGSGRAGPLAGYDTATVKADWLHELLVDLPIVEKPLPAILMNCDNQTMIVKVDDSNGNMKSSRHIKRRLKSVRKMRNSGVTTLDYIHTEKNLADPFTKGLPHNVIDAISKEMGLRPT